MTAGFAEYSGSGDVVYTFTAKKQESGTCWIRELSGPRTGRDTVQE